MADNGPGILHRINRWFGGITDNERDTAAGVHLRMEEVDIFSSKSLVRPTTILATDSTIETRVSGYDVDDQDNLYALTRISTNGPKIWKKTSASADAPGSWSSYIATGGVGSMVSPIKWHQYSIGVTSLTRTSHTFTVTIASPAVFTLNSHGFVAGDRVRFYTDGALPTGLSTDTDYYIISAGLNTNNFEVSTSLNGSAVNTSGSQSGTHTVQPQKATVTTNSTHGLATGDTVVISGATPNDYNGSVTITNVPTTTTFEYYISGNPTSPATGTITALAAYVFWCSGFSSGNISLNRGGTTPSGTTVYSSDRASTSMVLPGAATFDDRISMCRTNGELHIGRGQYIHTIGSDGIFVPKNFTLPNGWQVMSMEPTGTYLSILARSTKRGLGYSKIFTWDFESASGPIDEKIVPMGGPQIIFKYEEILWAVCAINGILKVFNCSGVPYVKVMLDGVAKETYTDASVGAKAIVPDSTKFSFDNTVFFGVRGGSTICSGLYQFGRTDESTGYALVLGKRFAASFTADGESPTAAFGIGPNIFAGYLASDGSTHVIKKLEGNNSPTYSSNAVVETVYMDGGLPENMKEWLGFIATTKTLPTSCQIDVYAVLDDGTSISATTLKSMTPTTAQEIYDSSISDALATRTTYFRRDWTAVLARAVKLHIRFTSNGTTARPTLIMIAPMSTRGYLNG